MPDAKTLYIPGVSPFPNSPLPVLLYPGALPGAPARFDRLFRENGWTGVWVNGVYAFHHFHAEAHEALGCVSGSAAIQLGGPDGLVVEVKAGDALVLPAGVGHRLERASRNFSIAGAYPQGQSPDLQRGEAEGYEALRAKCLAVPQPAADPVLGGEGPLLFHWKAPASRRPAGRKTPAL